MSLGIQIKRKNKKIIQVIFFSLIIFFTNVEVYSQTILGALNKVSGKVSKLIIDDYEEIVFGTLKIIANTCKKSLPEEPPENSAFLEIWDIKHNEEEKKVFNGWMFSSSPSISALEHAVYDVWIIDCKLSYIDE